MADRLNIDLPEEADEPVTKIGMVRHEPFTSSDEVDAAEARSAPFVMDVAFLTENDQGERVLDEFKKPQYWEQFFPGLRPDQITWEMVKQVQREINGG